MPRGRLKEKYVQDVAVEWLASHYADHDDIVVTAYQKEKKVNGPKKIGWGRVDELIAMQRTDGRIHVASMEAKSSKTYGNIRPQYNDSKWFFHALIVGMVCALLAFIIGRFLGGWFWQWVLPIIVFIVGGIVYLLATMENNRYKSIDVIRQIKRYPANEQWIALSSDSYNLLQKNANQLLHKECQQNGIGLLRVGAGRKVFLVHHPVIKPTPASLASFLDYYACGQDMVRELGAKAAEASSDPQELIENQLQI